MIENYKDYEINYAVWSFNCEKFFFIATWEEKEIAKGVSFNERICIPIDNTKRDEEVKRCLKVTKKEIIWRHKKLVAKKEKK